MWDFMVYYPLPWESPPHQQMILLPPKSLFTKSLASSSAFPELYSYFILVLFYKCSMFSFNTASPYPKRIQTVCKPGSVRSGKTAGRPFLYGARCRAPLATNPGGGPKTHLGAHG
jgi:hypothetical protein